MLDRILHYATVVQIANDSYRLKDKHRAGVMARAAVTIGEPDNELKQKPNDRSIPARGVSTTRNGCVSSKLPNPGHNRVGFNVPLTRLQRSGFNYIDCSTERISSGSMRAVHGAARLGKTV
jgi:hypothetical protein